MTRRGRVSHVTWLMPLGTMLQFMLPRWVAIRLARIAGLLQFHLNPRLRRALLENYRHILKGRDRCEHIGCARRAVTHLVVNTVDLLRTPVLRRRTLGLAEFAPHALDNLRRALSGRTGAILVTAHIGNWDLAGVILTSLGYPVSAAVEPIPAGWTTTFNRYRSVSYLETIPTSDRRGLAQAIARRRILALVADRDLTGNGVSCPAFGVTRAFPKGPAAYALKYSLPIIVGQMVAQRRPGHPPYLIEIDEPLWLRPTDDTEVDIVRGTRLVAERLNRMIAQFPDQWLVFRAEWQ